MLKDLSSITALIICFLSSAVGVCGFSTGFSYKTTSSPSSFALSSIRSLVEDLTNNNNSNTKANDDGKILFVGGKGGVGKTTTSSALAVHLASDLNNGDQNVLIVSTDPAHSLGDALDVKLSGDPLVLDDPLTGGRLTAVEVDTDQALDDFRSMLEAFDVQKLADALGVQPGLLQDLGLGEFADLLSNPPPGLDEVVALSNVLDSAENGSYDIVIVDTAPTGHTLRLLALPTFLDGFLGKLIELRAKLSGFASTLQAFLGNAEANQRAQTIDSALSKLENFKRRISKIKGILSDSNKTNFVIVTVPTTLGVSESKRLYDELRSQGVQVTDIIVNQCVDSMLPGDDLNEEAMKRYYSRRVAGQQSCLKSLKSAAQEVSNSGEYQQNGGGSVQITETPFFDVELVGAPALSYLGKTCYLDNPAFEHLMHGNSDKSKVVIAGGKGGVGKTTTSSAIAVAMAEAGHRVAIISTDPAHSLGDALDMNLGGGSLVESPYVGLSSGGSLSAMEVDPSSALKQFKGVIDDLVGSSVSTGVTSSQGGIGSTLRELGQVFDTLPAGTDEIVALANVINIIRKGNFDRIVLDTAPTGHTLRMLSTPGFLADLIDRVLVISRKINSNPTVKMMISGATQNEEEFNSAAASAKSTLQSFQIKMFDLEDLFIDAESTEFLIVTILTELAVRESMRLLNDLTFEDPDMPIKVRNIVANQVLSDDGDDVNAFLGRVSKGQSLAIQDMRLFSSSSTPSADITIVPFIDTEPRGVFGLKALSEELLRESMVEHQ